MSNPGVTDLIAYWALDETAGTRADSHTGGYDLTEYNTVGYVAGVQGNAASFVSASSEYLARTTDDAAHEPSGDFSFVAWVKLDSKPGSGNANIVGKWGSLGAQYQLFYRQSVDRFRFAVRCNPSTPTTYTATANTLGSPSTGTWYMVYGEFDQGTHVGISVNAGTIDTSAASSTMIAGSTPLQIAYEWSAATLDGKIDELAFFNRKLTSAEITWLYNSGSGRTYSDINPPAATKLSAQTGPPLSLIVFDDAGYSQPIADWSRQAENIQFDTDKHGFGYLSAFVRMPHYEAHRYYDAMPVEHIELTDGADIAFKGRIEDKAIVPGGLRIGAFGYQRVLKDALIAELWSTEKFDKWYQLNEDDAAAYVPALYEMDNDARLYISPRVGETFAHDADAGAFFFIASGDRKIKELEITYDVSLPTDWRARIISCDEPFVTSANTEWTVTTSGSGSATVTLSTARKIVWFEARNNTGANSTPTGDTGDHYAKLTAVRVKTTEGDASTGAVYADEIVKAIISDVSALSSHLSSKTHLVDAPGVDLKEAAFWDITAADVMNQLSAADDSTPPARYSWSIWEDRFLRFSSWPRTDHNTWYIDVASIYLESTINDLYNSVYAVYHNPRGIRRSTGASTDAESVTTYGITRQGFVATSTQDYAGSVTWRDAMLKDTKQIEPRAEILVSAVFTDSGGRVKPWLVRAGDIISARLIGPGSPAIIDEIKNIPVGRTLFDVDTGLLTITPGADIPTLQALVAQNAMK